VLQAALDVFAKEPPAADNPLVGREDVVCTPHLGASTQEAQEGVAVEIAEAVVSALKVWPPPYFNALEAPNLDIHNLHLLANDRKSSAILLALASRKHLGLLNARRP
jgi:D-3-phosphoglycerate dehydrogenase